MPKLKYSPQATQILEHLGDKIDVKEFEDYVEKNYFIVGGNHIFAFLADTLKNKK